MDMQNRVYSLIEDLRRISPIPDDDSNDQTPVILDTYDVIINQLDELIKENPWLADYVSPKAVIDSFGYGVAYGVYWDTIDLIRLLPKTEVLCALRECLLHGQQGTRQWSAMLLGQYRDREAVPLLIQALRDPMPYVRADAAQSLGMIGDRNARESLKQLLEDPDEDVRVSAADALLSLDPASDEGGTGCERY